MTEEEKKIYFKVSKYCVGAERCRQDVEKKLKRLEIPLNEYDIYIKKLEEEHYINEERYAQAFANDKSRFNAWGPRKIAFKLRQKGIDEQVIERVLTNLGEESDCQKGRLLELLKAKISSIKEPDPYKRFAKLVRYASNKGYEYPDIKECIGKLDQESDFLD